MKTFILYVTSTSRAWKALQQIETCNSMATQHWIMSKDFPNFKPLPEQRFGSFYSGLKYMLLLHGRELNLPAVLIAGLTTQLAWSLIVAQLYFSTLLMWRMAIWLILANELWRSNVSSENKFKLIHCFPSLFSFCSKNSYIQTKDCFCSLGVRMNMKQGRPETIANSSIN